MIIDDIEIEMIYDFYSEILDNFRNIRVYLPPSYDLRDDKHYPVLYIHDGQNIFDPEESYSGKAWDLHKTADYMIRKEMIEEIIKSDFGRITYTEAIEILEKAEQKWEFPVKWGVDLQSEHEKYLVEKHFKRPVMVTDYPKAIKAFYMKQNDDDNTVRALDVLFPGIGEVIGGSQREEEYDKLYNRIKELNIPEKDLWWYLETRKYGTVPHSGFGLGFERLMLFVTGMSNIRDVMPFPRTPKNAEF